MVKPRYYVETYDPEREEFTPQKGVRKGPYSLWGLRKAIRKLRVMGYECGRQDSSVFVWIEPTPMTPAVVQDYPCEEDLERIRS